MSPDRVYSYCFWARLGAGSPANATASIAMISNASPFATVATAGVVLSGGSQVHQLACMRGLRPAAAGSYFFHVYLGSAVALYQVDDASLEYA